MIVDVARHMGFAGPDALGSVPFERFRRELPVDSALVAGVRRTTVEVLTGWSLDPGVVADSVLAAHALAGAVLASAAHHAAARTEIDVAAFPSFVRIAIADDAPSPAELIMAAERALGVAWSGRQVRWGMTNDLARRLLWVEVPLAAGDGTTRTPAVRPRAAPIAMGGPDAAVSVDAVAAAFVRALRREVAGLFLGLAAREHDRLHYLGLDPAPAATVLSWPGIPLERSSPGATACRDGVALVHGTAADAEAAFPGVGDDMETIGAGSIAHVPLFDGRRCIGVLGAAWPQPHAALAHQDDLADLGRRIGSALAPRLADGGLRAGEHGGQRRPEMDHTATVLASGPVRINMLTRAVMVANHRDPVRLTGREYDLLVHLVRHTGQIQTRRDLLRDVWGIDFDADTSVIEVTISRLRRRLGVPDLRTIKDVGYVFGHPAGDGAG